MFGWLKSLFGNEPEAERIVPPPLPSKVKKAEKIVAKKASKRAVAKKEAPVESVKEAPKAKAVKAPRKKKEVAVEVSPVPVEETVPATTTPKKKGGRTKKENKVG